MSDIKKAAGYAILAIVWALLSLFNPAASPMWMVHFAWFLCGWNTALAITYLQRS